APRTATENSELYTTRPSGPAGCLRGGVSWRSTARTLHTEPQAGFSIPSDLMRCLRSRDAQPASTDHETRHRDGEHLAIVTVELADRAARKHNRSADGISLIGPSIARSAIRIHQPQQRQGSWPNGVTRNGSTEEGAKDEVARWENNLLCQITIASRNSRF